MKNNSHRIQIAFPLYLLFGVLVLVVVLLAASCARLPGSSMPLSGEYLRPDLDMAERATIDKYRAMILAGMQQQNVPGLALAVVDDQGILWQEGFGCTDTDCRTAVTPDTLFSVQSTSKSVTATAVMFALQEGLVDLDTPVSKYLPDFHVKSVFEERPEDKMTLRHLLSHTAGFTHDPPYGNNNDMGPYSLEEHIRSISQTWLRFPVGANYGYSNIGPDLAAYIVQVRSGKPFYQYVQERVLEPLGMTRSSFDLERVRRDPNRAIGHTWPFAHAPFDMAFVGAGGFYTSANEMAQYIRLHMNRGNVDGKQLLDSNLLDTMYASYFDASERERYGLGIWRGSNDGVPILFHNGGGVGFGCAMLWHPDLQLGMIWLTNSTDHDLQLKLAPRLLDDLVDADSTIYHQRLQAFQMHFPSQERVNAFGPIASQARAIRPLSAMASGNEQRLASYSGLYRIKTWNLVTELWRFEEKNGQMYLDGAPMVEVRPGVFLSPYGETFDLTGPVPLAWAGRYADKAKNEMTPIKQGIFGLCALLFLATLFVPPALWLMQRVRQHPVSSQHSNDPVSRTAFLLAALTGIIGLACLAVICAYPVALYQDGFALNADLALDARLMLSLPLALGVGTLALIALNVIVWKRDDWSRGRRFYYGCVMLAAVAQSILLFGWNLVSFGF